VSSKEGVLWNSVAANHVRSWTAHFGFRIHSDVSSPAFKTGADGFAFWYTTRPQWQGGAVHGLQAARMGDGIGVIFDTFDNDGMKDNPAVYVIRTYEAAKRRMMRQRMEVDGVRSSSDEMTDREQRRPVNDRRTNGRQSRFVPDPQELINQQLDLNTPFTKGIDPDPSNDYKDIRLGQCIRNFRNTLNPSHVIVKYRADDKTLLVAFSDQHCIIAQNIELPVGGYFGFSAHTGGASDNHDIHYFIVMSDDVDAVEQFDEELDKQQSEEDSTHSYQKGGFDKNADVAERRKWDDFDEKGLVG
jgi:hypothetical protein